MSKIKKLLSGAVAGAIAVCVLAATAFAYTGTGTVKVNTYLNVRSSPSTTAAITNKLYNGTKVTIIDTSNGWYKISYNGATGWVSGSYVSVPTVSSRIQTVVNTANSALGVKYVFGGTSPSTGLDCSGLTMYCFAKAGVTLPHNSSAQSTLGVWVSRSNLHVGDVIFFSIGNTGSVNHCGIYIGGGNFINAQSGAGQVKVASLATSYWSNAYFTSRRYIY